LGNVTKCKMWNLGGGGSHDPNTRKRR
jgi:hypothetical protein